MMPSVLQSQELELSQVTLLRNHPHLLSLIGGTPNSPPCALRHFPGDSRGPSQFRLHDHLSPLPRYTLHILFACLSVWRLSWLEHSLPHPLHRTLTLAGPWHPSPREGLSRPY